MSYLGWSIGPIKGKWEKKKKARSHKTSHKEKWPDRPLGRNLPNELRRTHVKKAGNKKEHDYTCGK